MPVSVDLELRAPFDGEALLAHLGARAIPGIEAVFDGRYRRSLRAPGGPAVVELAPAADRVRLTAWLADADDLPGVVERCRAMFDLDADPAEVADVLAGDALLAPLIAARPGLRVPGHPDGAELALRAVVGQQISLAGAATLAGRMVAAHGEPLAGRPPGGVTHLWPEPGRLAALDPAELPMPRARAIALLALARALADGSLDLRRGVDPGRARAALLALPGVGPWTAEYVAMRALGDRDAFLVTDLGVRRALERLGQNTRPRAVARLAERWRPLRAYANQHLWASRHAAAGTQPRVRNSQNASPAYRP
jgi:AraC family transcriptional regulator of adaptative response / DNA-3-methyladenine glycosylase II